MAQVYRLLTGSDDSDFCHKVSKALDEGWELHGSPSVSFDTVRGAVICAQAVTKSSAVSYDPKRKLVDY